ncbi:unnamed protein product [Closterium sp. Naga37s-1]|nr:unnamed protein product [Closterium sp. Naga37s-1]
MQPRDPRQITPAPPSLAPPVLHPPIAKSPPVKPPPVKPPPVKPPPVKPPPVKPPPVAPAPPPPFFQPWPINGQGIFNVLQFGARADGRTDNTDAFRRALRTACAWGKARSAYARVVVPASGLFQTFPVDLEGPCGAGLEVQVGGKVWKGVKGWVHSGVELEGPCGGEPEVQVRFRWDSDQRRHCRASQRDLPYPKPRLPLPPTPQPSLPPTPHFPLLSTHQINDGIVGPANVNGGIVGPANVTSYPKPRKSNAWALLFFREVPNLAVTGGGWMDGRGAGFWARGKGSKRPALLFLMHCDNATVQGIGMTNPGKAHLKVYGSNGLLIERITTRSPFNSPNTDSIQLSKIENGIIRNSHLQGGDDNVAIGNGCHNLLVENLVCINGHGVSIGSLGEDRDTGCVSDVLVRNVSFTGSNNALRIKTYQGGKGLVSNVTYKDIRVTDVTWPIIINQFYCDTSASKCRERQEAVAVTDISFINVKGTANGTHAILFNCSRSVPCTSLLVSGIAIAPSANRASSLFQAAAAAAIPSSSSSSSSSPSRLPIDSPPLSHSQGARMDLRHPKALHPLAYQLYGSPVRV